MGGAVFSGGDIMYSGGAPDLIAAASAAAAACGIQPMITANSSASHAAGTVSAVSAAATAAAAIVSSAAEFSCSAGSGEGAAAVPVSSGMPAATSGYAGESLAIDTLTTTQLAALLAQEEVQQALAQIVAQPKAVVEYEKAPIILGVLYALAALA